MRGPSTYVPGQERPRRPGRRSTAATAAAVAIDPKDADDRLHRLPVRLLRAPQPEDGRARAHPAAPGAERGQEGEAAPLQLGDAVHPLAALARDPLLRRQPALPLVRPRRDLDRDLRRPHLQPRAGRRALRHHHARSASRPSASASSTPAPTRARSGSRATAARPGPTSPPGSPPGAGSRAWSPPASTKARSTSPRTAIATTSSRPTSSGRPTTARPGSRWPRACPRSRSTPSARTRKAKHLLYVGTDMGVFVSLDSGKTWTALAGGLPHVPVHDLQVHPREGDLVLATHGRSVYLAEAAPLRKLTADVMGKAVFAFPIKDVAGRPRARLRRASVDHVAAPEPWWRASPTGRGRPGPVTRRDQGRKRQRVAGAHGTGAGRG